LFLFPFFFGKEKKIKCFITKQEMSDGLIARIKRDLEETRLVVVDTVQNLLERGERLDQLNDRTQHLLAQSERFEERLLGERRARMFFPNSTRILSAVASGVRWTARQSIVLTFLVLYYLGQVKNVGVWMFSILFPVHEGLTIERYNELDLYYDPHYVPLDDEDLWLSSGVSGEHGPKWSMERSGHEEIPQIGTGARKEKKK